MVKFLFFWKMLFPGKINTQTQRTMHWFLPQVPATAGIGSWPKPGCGSSKSPKWAGTQFLKPSSVDSQLLHKQKFWTQDLQSEKTHTHMHMKGWGGKGWEKEIFHPFWFTLQMTAVSRTGTGWNQEPRTPSRHLTWVTNTWAIFRCLPRHTNKKLHQKQSSWNSTSTPKRDPDIAFGSQYVVLHHRPWHSGIATGICTGGPNSYSHSNNNSNVQYSLRLVAYLLHRAGLNSQWFHRMIFFVPILFGSLHPNLVQALLTLFYLTFHRTS